MGVKHSLRSRSSKATEPSTLKANRSLVGGEENPPIEEQQIIPPPPLFEDYLFNKSFDLEFVSCSADPPYIACGQPDDLLTMDVELKHILQLGTCRGDFTPTTDVVFKSHTSFSKG